MSEICRRDSWGSDGEGAQGESQTLGTDWGRLTPSERPERADGRGPGRLGSEGESETKRPPRIWGHALTSPLIWGFTTDLGHFCDGNARTKTLT